MDEQLRTDYRLSRVRAQRKEAEYLKVCELITTKKLDLFLKDDYAHLSSVARGIGWSTGRLRRVLGIIWQDSANETR